MVSELRNARTSAMNSSTACEADSVFFVSSSIHRFELHHIALAASREGHWYHVPASESTENLMPPHNHRGDALRWRLRVSLQSACGRYVFVPEEERCRNVGSFPVQNVNSHAQISSARGSQKATRGGKTIRATTPVGRFEVGLDEVSSTVSESLPLSIYVKSLAGHASA